MKHFISALLFGCFWLPLSAQRLHYKVVNFVGGKLCPTEPWKLVFYDEFNGQQLDRTKWYSYYPYAPGNKDTCVFCRRHEQSNSQQIYKDENVVVSNGTLKLAIKKEPATWMGVTTQFTSGLINSVLSFSNYAKYEIRCKLPKGKGFWPAFWVFGGGTEIDIFETGGHEPNTIHSVVHRWMSNGARFNNGSFEFTGNNFVNEFNNSLIINTIQIRKY